MAETFQITWSIQHGYGRVVLEVYPELLVKWVQQEITPLW